MREIKSERITTAVAKAVVEANIYLPESLCKRISECAGTEENERAASVFKDMLENLDIAAKMQIPVCQDTGMAVIFAEIGQDVHIAGEDFESAVNRGVAQGYTEGYLRKSVVADPLRRVNTGDNTPAIIHVRIVPGDKLRITVAPKGFGSENMSAVKMFNPTADEESIIDFVKQTVFSAGARPCPPLVIGVGIGGDFEYAAILAKRALCRDVSKRNNDTYYADIEEKMLAAINSLDIGPQGFGGINTALSVNIEQYPTHIAGLPVAVNIGCHVTRHIDVTL